MTTWRSYWLDMIDLMADEAQAEIKRMADDARQQIRRKAEFPARSAGQIRRYQRIKQGEVK